MLDGDNIRMLLPFTQLETVTLENRGGIAFSDSHIVSLMQVWPSLQTLSLVQPMEDASLTDDAEDLVDSDGEALEKIDTPVVYYTCTVLGLLEIARRATSLHALTFSVDFSDIPQQLGDRPFDNNVTSLHLWKSEVGSAHPKDVAHLLCVAFPRTVSSFAVSPYDGLKAETCPGPVSKWDEVRHLVEMERNQTG